LGRPSKAHPTYHDIRSIGLPIHLSGYDRWWRIWIFYRTGTSRRRTGCSFDLLFCPDADDAIFGSTVAGTECGQLKSREENGRPATKICALYHAGRQTRSRKRRTRCPYHGIRISPSRIGGDQRPIYARRQVSRGARRQQRTQTKNPVTKRTLEK